MTLVLTLVLLLAVVYSIALARPGLQQTPAGAAVGAGFVGVSSLALAGLLAYHAGWAGSSLRDRLVRMEYRGVEVSVPREGAMVRISGSTIRAGDAERRGFRWTALVPGTHLDAKPIVEGSRIGGYRVDYDGTKLVRLNGVCVNTPLNGWLAVGSSADYALHFADGKTVSIRISAADGRASVSAGGQTCSGKLEKNQSLGVFLEQNGGSAMLPTLGDARETILARRTEKSASELGILGPVAASAATDTIPADGQGRFRLRMEGDALALPSLTTPAEGGKVGLRFGFLPAPAYALPPAKRLARSKGAVIMASSDLQNDLPGYVFDIGNESETTVVRAQVGDGATVSIGGKSLVANVETSLGAGAVRPVVALSDSVSLLGGTWALPTIGILLGGVIVAFSLLRTGELDRAAAVPLLYVGVVGLIVVRAVLAYRVSVFPPGDLSAATAEQYAASWPEASRLLTFFVPLFGLLAGVVATFLGDEGTLSRWKRRRAKSLEGRDWRTILRHGGIALLAVSLLVLVDGLLTHADGLRNLGFGLFSLGLVGLAAATGPMAGALYALATIVALMVAGRLLASPGLLLALLLTGLGLLATALSPQERTTWNAAKADATMPLPIAFLRWLFDSWGLIVVTLALVRADLASLVYAVPLIVARLMPHAWQAFARRKATDDARRRIGSMGALAAVGAICLLWLALPSLSGPLASYGASSLRASSDRTLFYRLVSGDPEQTANLLASDESRNSRFEANKLPETLQQRWQMISYVKGGGQGYVAAPIVARGVAYPIFLTDAAFSTLLAGEHGKMAAMLVIGLHLMVAAGLFWAAADCAQDGRRRNQAFVLYAFGGTFGFLAVYMGLANLWKVPFTGQNVPLLAPGSWTDLALFLGLATFGLAAMAYTGEKVRGPSPQCAQWMTFWAFPAALALAWVWRLGGALMGTTGDGKQPFNLPAPVYDRLETTLSEAQDEISPAAPLLAKTKAFQNASLYLRRLAGRFDAGSVSDTPLVQGASGGRTIFVDRKRLVQFSPLADVQELAWTGSLVPRKAITEHALIIPGRTERFVLRRGEGAEPWNIGGVPTRSSAERLEFRSGAENYGGVYIEAGGVRLRWNGVRKGAQLYVNDELQRDGTQRDLAAYDMVEVRPRDGVRGAGSSFTYLGSGGSALATVVWRNGELRRIYPQGSDFPLAYSLAKAADSSAKGEKDITLSLDLGLQRSLQRALREYASESRPRRPIDSASTWRSRDGLPFTAVCVLDSYDGKVRAIASVPQSAPTDDLASEAARYGTEQNAAVATRSSWALVNRTIGSPIKPISLSSLATGLNRDGFDIARLSVNESWSAVDGKFRRIGRVVLPEDGGIAIESGVRKDVDMHTYLRDSRTWPAAMTATLGLAPAADLTSKWLLPGDGGLQYAGSPRRLAFPPSAETDRDEGGLFTNREKLDLAPTALDHRPLFVGMAKTFAPFVQYYDEARVSYPPEMAKAFLPFLATKIDLSTRLYALPEPHYADSTAISRFQDFLTYAIGGGECRWNATVMAAVSARLATGQKVMPTLAEDAIPLKETVAGPLGNPQWRRSNIEAPLLASTTLQNGTEIRAGLPDGYRLMLKTGTIDEEGHARQNETLSFTLGEYRDATGFVKGHAVSGFISIRSARESGVRMVKDDLLRRLLPPLLRFLREAPTSVHVAAESKAAAPERRR